MPKQRKPKVHMGKMMTFCGLFTHHNPHLLLTKDVDEATCKRCKRTDSYKDTVEVNPGPLEKCPFCGSRQVRFQTNDIQIGKNMYHQRWVECGYCAASTGFFFTTNEARKAWNQRFGM